MGPTFLIDENLRGLLWRYIQRCNARGGLLIDAIRIGDAPDLPLGSDDPAILLWAEREGRILVSKDQRTLPIHLANHLTEGHRSPGIFLVRDVPLAEIVEFMSCAAHGSDAAEWNNQVTFIP